MVVGKCVAKYVRVSPFKIRPVIEDIKGLRLDRAFNRLYSRPTAKVVSIFKALSSAWANAKNLDSSLAQDASSFKVVVATVNNGPFVKYSVPGSMGRAKIRRRRSSHLEIGLAKV